MNIHFSDKSIFEKIMNNKINIFKTGSELYGLNTENSDKDYLIIYLNSIENIYSINWSHHQLQYKNDNIDYNFTNLQNYIRNILTGDSTINFELLFGNEMVNSSLNFITEYKYDFINYNIIRSYLGMAKRDAKMLIKNSYSFKNMNEENYKKYSHFLRGVIFSEMLIKNEFTLDLENSKNSLISDISNKELLLSIKNGNILNLELNKIYELFYNKMEEIRNELNVKHDSKIINNYMNTKKLIELDNKIIEFSNNNTKIENIKESELYLNILEEGIIYN